jgi:hypothetical protein
MGMATLDRRVAQNPQHAPAVNQAVVRQRLCSGVMLLLSGATVFVSHNWTYVAALVASVVSMLATWIDRRWSGPIWAVFTTAAFVLWAWWQFGI